jgi:hypothetical protein
MGCGAVSYLLGHGLFGSPQYHVGELALGTNGPQTSWKVRLFFFLALETLSFWSTMHEILIPRCSFLYFLVMIRRH